MAAETRTQELKLGNLIVPFRLPAANQSRLLGPWDYKQHNNLVLFFFHDSHCSPCRQRLADLAKNYSEYHQLNAEVLALSKAGTEELQQLQRELQLPFPLLSDVDGGIFRAYLNQVAGTVSPTGFFIADRWGILYTKAITPDADGLPADNEIRDWLTFIEIQCPECFPSEWPV